MFCQYCLMWLILKEDKSRSFPLFFIYLFFTVPTIKNIFSTLHKNFSVCFVVMDYFFHLHSDISILSCSVIAKSHDYFGQYSNHYSSHNMNGIMTEPYTSNFIFFFKQYIKYIFFSGNKVMTSKI